MFSCHETCCLNFAEVLDAIVVGMDMLIKKYGATNKGKKRLCLITNAVTPTKDPYEGTKEDQVKTVAAQMMTHGMKMDCIVSRAKQDWDVDKKIVEENDFLLSLLSNKSSSKVYVESATSLLGALRTRNISPVTIYRGDFELSSKMKIKVRLLYMVLIISWFFNLKFFFLLTKNDILCVICPFHLLMMIT